MLSFSCCQSPHTLPPVRGGSDIVQGGRRSLRGSVERLARGQPASRFHQWARRCLYEFHSSFLFSTFGLYDFNHAIVTSSTVARLHAIQCRFGFQFCCRKYHIHARFHILPRTPAFNSSFSVSWTFSTLYKTAVALTVKETQCLDFRRRICISPLQQLDSFFTTTFSISVSTTYRILRFHLCFHLLYRFHRNNRIIGVLDFNPTYVSNSNTTSETVSYMRSHKKLSVSLYLSV